MEANQGSQPYNLREVIPGVFRCGAIDWCDHTALGAPNTIINLRNEQCEERFCPALVEKNVIFISCPKPKGADCYETAMPEIKQWLNDFVRLFESPHMISYPVVVHCKAGRDRTGVAIAALLLIMGTPEDEVMDDFQLSPATPEHIQLFEQSLVGFRVKGGLSKYFAGINLKVVRANLVAVSKK